MNGKRKFYLTLYALVIASMLCFAQRITGSEFVTVVSIALGMYKLANVADKKLNGVQGNG